MTRTRKPTLLLSSLLLATVALAGCLPSSTSAEPAKSIKSIKPTTTTSTTTSTTVPPTTTTTAAPTTTTTVAPAPAPSGGFVHPGVVVAREDLEFVRAKIAAGQQPWKGAYDRILSSGSSEATEARPTRYRYSSLSYVPAPVEYVQSGGTSSTAYMEAHPELGYENIGVKEHPDDAQAAYAHALLWYYTGNQAYAKKAIEIMNAWSYKLKEIKFATPTNPENGQPLYNGGKMQAAWGGALFARAAEIIRHTGAGWSATDVAKFESMLHNIYRPITITGWSNGANWLTTLAEATIAIGVFTNNRSTFDAGVAMWRQKVPTTIYMPADGPTPIPPSPSYDTAAEMKALWYNPTSYIAGLHGEALRDISHMAMGLGAMANGAETAKIQGVDLFGEQKSRIVTGYELAAGFVNQYLDKVASLGGAQPPSTWKPEGWPGATFKVGGLLYVGGWEVAYSHYGVEKGTPMPQTKRLVERLRPTPGGALHLSWQTLTDAR